MKTLHTFSLESMDHLVSPEEFRSPDLHSPAMAICTDFREVRPLIIEADTSIDDAEHFMRSAHVKFKLVVDHDMELVGTISYQDLIGEQAIKRVAEGQPRAEIRVADMMTPRSELTGLDIQELESATIEDVINTLKERGEQHCLIVDHEHHQIRGLISASDIARRLHIPLVIEKMPSFIEIFDALKSHPRPSKAAIHRS